MVTVVDVLFALIWARFHYKRGKEHTLVLLLIFPRLKLKRALSKAKKSIKQRIIFSTLVVIHGPLLYIQLFLTLLIKQFFL